MRAVGLPRWRSAAPWIVPAALGVVLAGLSYAWLVSRQAARVFFDSSAYLEAAQQPWSWAQLYYPKPVFVSLVYRWIGTDPGTIAWFQAWLGFLAWTSLAVVLLRVLRARLARLGAVAVVATFLFAPLRLGYAAAVLSESINDSLLVLGVALTIALLVLPARSADPRRRGGLRAGLATALLAVLAAWMFTRDTNAIIALGAVTIAMAGWLRPRWPHRFRAAGAVLVVGLAAFILHSTSVRPQATGLTVQRNWPADFTARGAVSALNNVVDRVLPDAEARAFFAERGLPQAQELAQVTDRGEIIAAPRYQEGRRWIADHSRAVFVRWLLAHPVARLTDQVTYAWTLLGVDGEQSYCMPARGWSGRTRLRWLGLGSMKPVVIALIAWVAVVAWRQRRRPLVQLALVLVISGWLGSLAAFYGDTAEPARHCFGSGQQVLLGLYLAWLAWLDAWSAPRPTT